MMIKGTHQEYDRWVSLAGVVGKFHRPAAA
jgi:hypothetical protein